MMRHVSSSFMVSASTRISAAQSRQCFASFTELGRMFALPKVEQAGDLHLSATDARRFVCRFLCRWWPEAYACYHQEAIQIATIHRGPIQIASCNAMDRRSAANLLTREALRHGSFLDALEVNYLERTKNIGRYTTPASWSVRHSALGLDSTLGLTDYPCV